MIVRVSPEAQKKIRILLEAGVFPSRAAAAAFLIHEGLATQDELFARVHLKLAEIESINRELLEYIERKREEIKGLQDDLKGLVRMGPDGERPAEPD